MDEPAVKHHIFDVARFWIKEVGIDGWRLDVAHEIHPDFWREFRRKVCDDAKPDGTCLLVGEMIHGNYNGWVGNDRLHSGTNYQMSHAATWHSLNEHNYEYFYSALMREANLFKGLSLVNFLGNHDVPRIASNLTNPAHYTHAHGCALFMKGIPCLYYRDEFGMEGRLEDGTDDTGGDDAMRRPMLDCAKPATWPAVGQSRLALNKKLIAMRKNYLGVRPGGLAGHPRHVAQQGHSRAVHRGEVHRGRGRRAGFQLRRLPRRPVAGGCHPRACAHEGWRQDGRPARRRARPSWFTTERRCTPGRASPTASRSCTGPSPNLPKVPARSWAPPLPPRAATAPARRRRRAPTSPAMTVPGMAAPVDPTVPTTPQPGIGEHDLNASAAYGAMQDEMAGTLAAPRSRRRPPPPRTLTRRWTPRRIRTPPSPTRAPTILTRRRMRPRR